MNKLRQFHCSLKSVSALCKPQVLSSAGVRFSCGEGKAIMKGVVVGLYQKEGDKDPKLTPAGQKIDQRVQGKLMKVICETKLDGRLGRGKVFHNIDTEFAAVAVVGVGLDGPTGRTRSRSRTMSGLPFAGPSWPSGGVFGV